MVRFSRIMFVQRNLPPKSRVAITRNGYGLSFMSTKGPFTQILRNPADINVQS